MFEPQPTPFGQSQFPRPSPYGVTIANAGIPEYAFAPTPLGQDQLFLSVANGGCGSGSGSGISSGISSGIGGGGGLGGPLVGEKTPSHAISQEYAKADPTYVAKTMVSHLIAHGFSHDVRSELEDRDVFKKARETRRGDATSSAAID
ncbi:hypothetical protein SLS62_006960 [Diatrype stigma]|uniref:Uncharacterized protein n=1 Tax=Diatrype stigma TaxID=117547 RepID=A0AAN9YR83_9PEZI